jgi:hypothetical protein
MSRFALTRRTGGAILAVAAGALLMSAAPSPAAPPPLTFDGQCQLSGTVSFSPRMTTTPGIVRNYPSATGTCSGSLRGRDGKTVQLSNAAVRYRALEVGTQESCGSNLNASGSGVLLFNAGPVRFRIVENRVSGTAALSFTGAHGGSATAVANVNTPNPPGLLEQCAMGGVASVPVQLVIRTTPSISG